MSKLTYADRVKIEALHEAGFSASKVAEQLGRHRSSITRELSRNAHNGVYKADYAASSSKQRRKTCGKTSLTEDNWTQIRVLIQSKWSPEQISGWLKQHPEFGFQVSHQWIYEYIRQNQQKGGNLHTSLRRGGRPYKNRKIYRGTIKDRICIDMRPEIVNKIGSVGRLAPTAHRTVRTGPYTAPHANMYQYPRSNQCGSLSFDLTNIPFWINHLLGYARSTAFC